MNFLADMGIAGKTVNWLRDRTHDCIHLRDEGLQKISDNEIVQKALRENRIILTCDLDFGDIISASEGVYPSVIIFRLTDERPANMINRLEDVLKQSDEVLLKGAIISVEETRHRVRMLPI